MTWTSGINYTRTFKIGYKDSTFKSITGTIFATTVTCRWMFFSRRNLPNHLLELTKTTLLGTWLPAYTALAEGPNLSDHLNLSPAITVDATNPPTWNNAINSRIFEKN
jgi:hypothetical protein